MCVESSKLFTQYHLRLFRDLQWYFLTLHFGYCEDKRQVCRFFFENSTFEVFLCVNLFLKVSFPVGVLAKVFCFTVVLKFVQFAYFALLRTEKTQKKRRAKTRRFICL